MINPIKLITYFISYLYQQYQEMRYWSTRDYVSTEWMKEQKRK